MSCFVKDQSLVNFQCHVLVPYLPGITESWVMVLLHPLTPKGSSVLNEELNE